MRYFIVNALRVGLLLVESKHKRRKLPNSSAYVGLSD